MLTFLGIYPWCFAMLRIGHYFNGNYETFKAFTASTQLPLYGYMVIFLGGIGIWFYGNKKCQNNKFNA